MVKKLRIESNSPSSSCLYTLEIVIPAKFDEVGSFADGLAWVRLGDEHGYIDKAGNFVWKAKTSH